MKTIAMILLAVLLAVSFGACSCSFSIGGGDDDMSAEDLLSDYDDESPQDEPLDLSHDDAVDRDVDDIPAYTEDELIGTDAQALFEVFKEVREYWQGTYVAIDPDKVPIDDADEFFGLVKADLETHGQTLLLMNESALISGGYLSTDGDMVIGFNDGFIFSVTYFASFSDTAKVSANAWYGNLGAEGADYNLELDESGKWVMSEEQTGTHWIS